MAKKWWVLLLLLIMQNIVIKIRIRPRRLMANLYSMARNDFNNTYPSGTPFKEGRSWLYIGKESIYAERSDAMVNSPSLVVDEKFDLNARFEPRFRWTSCYLRKISFPECHWTPSGTVWLLSYSSRKGCHGSDARHRHNWIMQFWSMRMERGFWSAISDMCHREISRHDRKTNFSGM